MRRRVLLATIGSALVLVVAGGCGGASKQELREAYARGARTGREEGEARTTGRLQREWEAGYEEGLSDGEEEARGAVSDLEEELEFERDQQEEELGQLEAEEEELEGQYGYEYEPSYEYEGQPTTEGFGEGNGYVVECEDGTLSDSGGIQGACSHHGGVR